MEDGGDDLCWWQGTQLFRRCTEQATLHRVGQQAVFLIVVPSGRDQRVLRERNIGCCYGTPERKYMGFILIAVSDVRSIHLLRFVDTAPSAKTYF